MTKKRAIISYSFIMLTAALLALVVTPLVVPSLAVPSYADQQPAVSQLPAGEPQSTVDKMVAQMTDENADPMDYTDSVLRAAAIARTTSS